MARITVEDCVDKFPCRFELVLVASQRARKLHSVQTFGRIRPYPALLIDTRVYIWKNTQMQDLQPIYMSCANKNCGKFLGSLEEDFADLLSGLCLVCFREQTGQAEMN